MKIVPIKKELKIGCTIKIKLKEELINSPTYRLSMLPNYSNKKFIVKYLMSFNSVIISIGKKLFLVFKDEYEII